MSSKKIVIILRSIDPINKSITFEDRHGNSKTGSLIGSVNLFDLLIDLLLSRIPLLPNVRNVFTMTTKTLSNHCTIFVDETLGSRVLVSLLNDRSFNPFTLNTTCTKEEFLTGVTLIIDYINGNHITKFKSRFEEQFEEAIKNKFSQVGLWTDIKYVDKTPTLNQDSLVEKFVKEIFVNSTSLNIEDVGNNSVSGIMNGKHYSYEHTKTLGNHLVVGNIQNTKFIIAKFGQVIVLKSSYKSLNLTLDKPDLVLGCGSDVLFKKWFLSLIKEVH